MEKAKLRAEQRKAAKRASAESVATAAGTNETISNGAKVAGVAKTVENDTVMEVTTAVYKNAEQ